MLLMIVFSVLQTRCVSLKSNFALDAILCHALNFSSAHTTYTARGLFTAAASGDDMDIVNRILLGKVDGFVTVPRKHVVGVIQQ